MYRHDPRHNHVRELVRTGRVGDAWLLEATFSYLLEDLSNIRLRPERGGGALADVGCYGIDLARFLFEEEPAEVTARAVRGPTSGVDELTVTTLGFPSGRTAVVTAATRLARANAYKVRGTSGSISVPAAFVPLEADSSRVVVESSGSDQQQMEFPPFPVFARQIEHFARAAAANDPTLLAPAEDGVANTRVLAAAARSMVDGRTVILASIDN